MVISAVTMEDHDIFIALAGSVLTGKEPGQPIQDNKPHLDLPDGETKKKQGSNQSKTEGVGQDVDSKAEIEETPEGHGDDMSLEENQDDSERKAGSHSINDIEVATKSVDLEANVSASSRTSDSDQKKEELVGDPNTVGWDGPDEQKNAMNWPAWKIMAQIFLVSAITFIR